MNSFKTILTSSFLILCLGNINSLYSQPILQIKEVPFTQVHFTDNFWAPRIEINRTISIPSAFKECEKNGRFDNFTLAGGLIKGEHKGDFPFDDTDPYKIIEGASYSLAVKYDKKLDCYLDSIIKLIASAQEADGYLCTCVTNKCERLSGWWGTHRWEKINSHELYNCGHLYEAAVAHYQATGKKTLLNVAIKNADLVCRTFGSNEGQIHRPSGHPIVEMALCKLYKVTGNKKYLDTAKYFVEETGRCTDGHHPSEYSQDHKPILQQDEIVGHAVRAGYLFSGVTDVASLTQNNLYFNAIKQIWDNLTSKKLYITGGMGSRAEGEGFGPNYELNNHTAYCETCAAIANVYWNHRMFLATGNAKYADIVEHAIYNGVISGVSLSGNKFFYDNPLESMGEHERQAWFGCACCPGNITRFMASVPNYMYAIQNKNIYVNLYAQSRSRIELYNNKVSIVQETNYPWNGNIKMTIVPEKADIFSILFRIPGWVQESPLKTDLYTFTDSPKAFIIKINGKAISSKVILGYVTINRKWKKEDTIELIFPMNTRKIKANDKVEDDRGMIALERGPIVYCLEGKDQPDSTVFNKIIPLNTKIEANYDKDLLNGVIVLTGTAQKIEKDGTNKEIPFKAIPYSTWNNRGTDQMEVWIAQKAEYAHPIPQPTIASKAKLNMVTFDKDSLEKEESAWGTNDQWEPKRSSDISKPYFYWWLKSGSKEALEYDFDETRQVSSIDVYWLDFDQYDGDFRVPSSWKLYYLDGETWKEVESKDNYGVEKDKYNHLNFNSVKTKKLKIVVQLQKGESGGIIEWKVQ